MPSSKKLTHITIDNKVLLELNDIAMELFKDEFRFVRTRDMLVALHTLLVKKGIKPNFSVEIEDEGTWWKP